MYERDNGEEERGCRMKIRKRRCPAELQRAFTSKLFKNKRNKLQKCPAI
jgi:hypothetical protein